MTALMLVAGLTVPGAFVALTPSTAAAQGSDPLDPTIAQVEAFYATAVANGQASLASELTYLEYEFGLVEGDASLVSRIIFELADQPGCLLLTIEDDLGLASSPPNYDCLV